MHQTAFWPRPAFLFQHLVPQEIPGKMNIHEDERAVRKGGSETGKGVIGGQVGTDANDEHVY